MRVGIDLGTTYSLIARMGLDGTPVLLPDHSDRDLFHTPSAVCILPNAAFVGSMVETLLEQEPDLKVIRFFKRSFGDVQPLFIDEQGSPWYPEAIAALVLKKLRFDAESFSSAVVESAVITVPAHFNDPQRKAVLASAALADIPVLGLVEEPVAAALHYGVTHHSHDQVLLVYDLGGGTFDATVLSMNADGAYVLAKDGLTDVGGKEFDDKIAEIVLARFEREFTAQPNLTARTLLELRRASEEIKIELCSPGRTRVRSMVLLGKQALEIEISRDDFEASIQEYLEHCEAVLLSTVREAGLRNGDVDAILLVGGSSMIPLVQKRLKRVFAQPHQTVMYHEPSKAVAYGAAIYSSQLAGESEMYRLPPEFRGVTGYSVGVRVIDTEGRVNVDTLIKKNMPLPALVKRTYYTTRANQERMVLDLLQFRDGPQDAVSLGTLTVGPLPSPKQNYPIEVTVETRDDGTVAVQAYDAETGIELKQVFGRDNDAGIARFAAQRALVRGTFINNL